MYTAVLLDEISRNLLKEISGNFLEKTQYDSFVNEIDLPHHMTINLGEFDKELNRPEILGMQAVLRCSKLLCGEKVCCFEISEPEAYEIRGSQIIDIIPINTVNDEKSSAHVTLGIRNGGKPKDSRDLFNNPDTVIYDFPPIKLLGTIVTLS